MSPDREVVIGGRTITEYYWAGEMVVYVNGRLSGMTFEMACDEARKAASKQEAA